MTTKLPLRIQLKLARRLLAFAEKHMNNNFPDFDLVEEGGLTPEEVKTFQEASALTTTLESKVVVPNWLLMRYLAVNLEEPSALDPREALKVAEGAFLEASGWKRVVMPDKELWEAPRFIGLSEWQSIFPGDLIILDLAVAAQKGYDRYRRVIEESLRR